MRALFGYRQPSGGVVPDYRQTIIDHPYRLDPENLDNAKAFRRVSTVYACVIRRAEDMASIPLLVEREKGGAWEPVTRVKGNIVDVIHAGNPRQTGMEVRRDLHANFKIHGNAYLVAENFGGRRVQELWVMPSHLVEPLMGTRRMPKAYLFNRGGVPEVIPAENVIPWHDFQPDDEPIGMSALDAVRLQYETRYDLMRLLQKMVRNGGSVAGYMRVVQPTGAGAGVPIVLGDDEKRAMAEAIRRARRNPDLPVILDSLQFDRMGLTPAELQIVDNATMSDADICRVLGVPPWLIGIKEGAKLGDSGQSASADERIYWMNLRRELDMRDAMLTERLVPMFGEQGIRFRSDLSAVPALNAPLLNAAQQAVALAGRPVLTVNEVRRLNALPAIQDAEADELYTAPAPTPFGASPFGQDQPVNDPPDPEEDAPKDDGKPASASRLIDTPERTERWRGKDRLMQRYEAKFRAAFVGLLNERKAELLSRLETQGIRSLQQKRAIDLDAIFSASDDDEAAIQRIYEALIAERGAEAAREIALELELNLKARAVQEFIKARKTVGLEGALDTFMQSVRMSLAEGVGLNESLSELAARVAQKFEEAEQGRVLTIARTETVSAFNFATVEAWTQTGEVEQIEWLSARDSAVRESHAEADGQVVNAGHYFDVGGASLTFPGDPLGPPEETINCRCTVSPVISERALRRRSLSDLFAPRKVAPSMNGAHR